MTAHVQNHIHLSGTVNGGGDKDPNLTWAVNDRKLIPNVPINLHYSKTFHIFPNRILDTGVPVKGRNWSYVIKVQGSDQDDTQSKLETLLALEAKVVYLCDIFHCDVGSDHTTFIQQVIPQFPEGAGTDHYTLLRYMVRVNLTDATR